MLALMYFVYFLNDHIIDAATVVTDFQKSVSEVCTTEGQ